MGITLKKLYPGKPDPATLGALIEKYTTTDDRVIQGARIGEDATVIDMGDRCLVAKADPITFATDAIGAYAVYVNANDVACMGATPKWFLAVLLLPENATHDLAESIFADISQTCRSENIAYCGGHTEVVVGLDRPIVIGNMLGEVEKERLLLKRHARVGDHLLLVNGIPIEAVAIVGREKAGQMEAAFSKEFVERCRDYLYEPGISVLPAARVARNGDLHALHDPTEGGLATAVHEIAYAAGTGAVIYQEKIVMPPEAKIICDFYDLDPLGTIASGALLCVVPAKSAERQLAAFAQAGMCAADIGRLVSKTRGVVLIENGRRRPLPKFERDEILKIFV